MSDVNLGVIVRRYFDALAELREIREENKRLGERIEALMKRAEQEAASVPQKSIDVTA
jgi:hypothetical protein